MGVNHTQSHAVVSFEISTYTHEKKVFMLASWIVALINLFRLSLWIFRVVQSYYCFRNSTGQLFIYLTELFTNPTDLWSIFTVDILFSNMFTRGSKLLTLYSRRSPLPCLTSQLLREVLRSKVHALIQYDFRFVFPHIHPCRATVVLMLFHGHIFLAEHS